MNPNTLTINRSLETPAEQSPSRREFIARSGALAAVSALAGASLPPVFAGEDNTIRAALVGCGGRGAGAVHNALASEAGPVRLVAMADVFEEKLNKSYEALAEMHPEQVDVPEDRRFLGFDAYQKAIDCLRPGDLLIQATHSGFRAHHVEYAIQKGIHVFMEKSFAPDPAGTRHILKLGEEAKKKNLKVGCGLMCRHSEARQRMIERIREGAVGEVQMIRTYRLDEGMRHPKFSGKENEILSQIRRPYGSLWVSSGKLVDWMIHQIDECCWIKDSWPVAAQGFGGRAPYDPDCSQNLHAYSVEYTFADGTKAMVNSRSMKGCETEFSTYLHGTKCAAQFSGNVHAPTARIFKGQSIADSDVVWTPENEERNPYQVEFDELLTAIREDKPYNEVERSAYANLASLMGRAAVHMGKTITWDQMLHSDFRFASSVDFDSESPSPVPADEEGKYPIPDPGNWVEV